MAAGSNFHEEIINIRVSKALSKKEELFAQEHKKDSDHQLLQYIKQQAGLLGHAPRRQEIVGWSYIESRFNGWNAAIRKSGLEPHYDTDDPSHYALVKEEYALQEKLFRDRKAEKKQRAIQHRIKAEQQRKAEDRWRLEHGKPPRGKKKKKR